MEGAIASTKTVQISTSGVVLEAQRNAENKNPYYAARDFNHDGQSDFAIISKRGDLIVFNGPIRPDTSASFTARINSDDYLFVKHGTLLAGPWASDFDVELRWANGRYSLHE